MLKRRLCTLFVLPFVLLTAAPELLAGDRARESALRSVEEILWKHRLWPESNPGGKPALEEVLSADALREKSEEGPRKAAALEAWLQRPIGQVEVQAEIDRIFRETRDPEMLEEILVALGRDPELVADVIARPLLADRLLRRHYARDAMFHIETRARAEAALAAHSTAEEMKDLGGDYSEATWALQQGPEAAVIPEPGTIAMDAGEWSQGIEDLASQFGVELQHRDKNEASDFELLATADGLPIQLLSPLQESDDAFYVVAILESEPGRLRVANVQWPKEPFDAWWKGAREAFPPSDPTSGTSFTLPSALTQTCSDDTWESLSGPVGFSPRYEHLTLWTGSEMLVWEATTALRATSHRVQVTHPSSIPGPS